MKRTLFIAAFGMILASCQPKETKIILSTETLPTGQWVYTVSGSKPYTFIDDAGKYQIGQEVK